jgi:hypothetical protein
MLLNYFIIIIIIIIIIPKRKYYCSSCYKNASRDVLLSEHLDPIYAHRLRCFQCVCENPLSGIICGSELQLSRVWSLSSPRDVTDNDDMLKNNRVITCLSSKWKHAGQAKSRAGSSINKFAHQYVMIITLRLYNPTYLFLVTGYEYSADPSVRAV